MVRVTNPNHNEATDHDILEGHSKGSKNWNNVYQSSLRLEDATAASLVKGEFPIVFGGDHS